MTCIKIIKNNLINVVNKRKYKIWHQSDFKMGQAPRFYLHTGNGVMTVQTKVQVQGEPAYGPHAFRA